MSEQLNTLKGRILTEGVLDGEDIHHEFVSGMHGRKLDFDKILTASDLYELWTDCYAEYIVEKFSPLPEAIVGVANGANRLALTVAAKIGNGVVALTTQKDTSKSVTMTASSEDYIASYKPKHLLIIEDVGTSGTTSATAYNAVMNAGAGSATVLNTWQRRETLEKLDAGNIPYQAMIKEVLPTYAPDECEYCKQGIKLIERD